MCDLGKSRIRKGLEQQMMSDCKADGTLEQHAADVCNHNVQDTQAEDSVRQEQFEKLNLDIEAVQRELRQI
jgi:hypothetical protein